MRSFLSEHRTEILAAWQGSARELPDANGLAPTELLDHIPEVLDEIGEMAASASTAAAVAGRHALERLAEGFEVATVARELSLLRGAILDVLEREQVPLAIRELRALDLAIDRAIEASVARHTEAREAQFRKLAVDQERTLAKLESLLTASPVGIAFLDRELRYVRINEALAAVNGRPAHEHLGRTVREMLPPQAADQAEPMLRKVISSGQPALNLEFMLDGDTPEQRTWLLANYFPVRSPSGVVWGVGGVVTDVTEAKRTREALQVEQRRLQSIVEHAPAAIWVKDADGRVVLANHRLVQALGHAHEDVIGRRSDELLPRDIALAHQDADRLVLSENRVVEVEEVVPSGDGLRTFLSIKFPIPGEPPLVGGIATEITERKRMEEELRDAVRMRDDLLAVVSHDLRSPLATVQLGATVLLGMLTSDLRARRHLELIVRSCTRMEDLIEDLLDTARMRAGRFELKLEREVVDDVVSEALDLQLPLASEKGITLERVADLPGIELLCERDRILQVFGNLISNAIKFCRAGDTIRILGERDNDHVRFCIEDTGPGIAADALPNLFEPYWSGPQHTNQGSGLGLYIVRGIVEGHGGRVWADNRPGGGARFFFTLPILG